MSHAGAGAASTVAIGEAKRSSAAAAIHCAHSVVLVAATETGEVTVAYTLEKLETPYAHGANGDDGNRDAAAANKSSTVTCC